MELLWRLGLVVLLMAIVAWIDWRRHPAHATKWREYTFLLATGLLGGLIGVLVDNITATVSPEFFVLGKGISVGAGFRTHVAEFGFHAGLVAGIVIGGIYLLANNPKPTRPGLPYTRLLAYALRPILGAIVVMPIVAPLAYLTDPMGITAGLAGLVTPRQLTSFQVVWGLNLGLYAGGLLGVLWGVVGIRRSRRALSCEQPGSVSRAV